MIIAEPFFFRTYVNAGTIGAYIHILVSSCTMYYCNVFFFVTVFYRILSRRK